MRGWRILMAGGYHGRLRGISDNGGSMGRIAIAVIAGILSPSPPSPRRPIRTPSRPVKILVPYAPGGATDIIARISRPSSRNRSARACVVENRPGASGNIALEAVAKAPPTATRCWWATSPPMRSTRTRSRTLQIKPRAISSASPSSSRSRTWSSPRRVSRPTRSPTSSHWPRRNPGKINYASAGLGSYPHLDMEKLQRPRASS